MKRDRHDPIRVWSSCVVLATIKMKVMELFEIEIGQNEVN